MFTIRRATPDDITSITDIYNEAILKTDATFDTEPKSYDSQREWFDNHDSKHPVMVAEAGSRVIGWASLSKWSDRCAYSDTAEISLYITEAFRGKGAGKILLGAVLREGEKAGLHTVLARITEGNSVSVHLHERAGFQDIGVIREVGRKFGRLLDVRMMQKVFPSGTQEGC